MKHLIQLILMFLSLNSFSQVNLSITTTTKNEPWKTETVTVKVQQASDADIVITKSETLQTIEGFGGCFNELGWKALSQLSEADRGQIMSELFAPGYGAGFTICRMPLGANDFSMDWYSYNETAGDFEMKNFSIDNDKNTLIPFIHEALKKNPSIKLWASPWSPPSWMKWNSHYACAVPWAGLDKKYQNHLPADRQGKEGTNMFVQQDAYFKAYALYFGKFIDAYKTEGITISMVMPQNEFNSCQIFPSCTWTASGLATFIGRYLGPEMEKRNTQIMFGTMERPTEALVDTILNDPLAQKFIKGVGFQWAGKEAIPGIHKRYPGLKLYQTEQECGDGKNDWSYCCYAWTLMKHYIKNGASAYMYWNIALEKGGISRWGWSQNSLITVDTITKTYNYNYEFYLIKHVSQFVKPGAKLLKGIGSFDNYLAFVNPDNSVVIVVQNPDKTEKTIKVAIDQTQYAVKLKAGSFNTVIIP